MSAHAGRADSARASEERRRRFGWDRIAVRAFAYGLGSYLLGRLTADSLFHYCDENRVTDTPRDDACNALEAGGYEMFSIVPVVVILIAAGAALRMRRPLPLHASFALTALILVCVNLFAPDLAPGR